MGKRRRHFVLLGALAGAFGIALVLGAAVAGKAATTQQVTASMTCQPPTVKPASTVGCILTVTNVGGNTVNQVVVTDRAPGGTFSSSTSSRCTASGDTLTCDIGKLTGAGSAGSTFSELHELQVPASGTSFTQTVDGRYSPNPNNRSSDTISPVSVATTLDDSADFDGRFANANGESVQTGTAVSGSNPYATGATLVGAQAFAAGLTVREQSSGSGDPNCPSTGCFGEQVIQFEITPLAGSNFPAGYMLTIRISGQALPNGTKADELDVRHDGDPVPLCPATDPAGACVVSRTIERRSKDAIIVIEGPGDGNGGWGVG